MPHRLRAQASGQAARSQRSLCQPTQLDPLRPTRPGPPTAEAPPGQEEPLRHPAGRAAGTDDHLGETMEPAWCCGQTAPAARPAQALTDQAAPCDRVPSREVFRGPHLHEVRRVRHTRGRSWLATFCCAATECLAPITDSRSADSPPRAEIAPTQAYIEVGDTFQFQLEVGLSGPPAPKATSEEARWWVSDPTIAQIDSASGLVVGKRSGSATVSATVRGATASAQVVVAPAILVGAGDIAACTSSG